MKETRLKRGYVWGLDDFTDHVYAKYMENVIALDKVAQYSLLCFLVRVFRQRGSRKGKK